MHGPKKNILIDQYKPKDQFNLKIAPSILKFNQFEDMRGIGDFPDFPNDRNVIFSKIPDTLITQNNLKI